MLYFIGGPGRVGKSTLARRLFDTKRVQFMHADVLRDMLDSGFPEHRIKADGWAAIPDRIYPFLEKYATDVARTNEPYCIEGDSFLPLHIARLRQRMQLRACFLGNSCPDLELILKHEGRNAWMKRLPRTEQERIVSEIRAISRTFEEQSSAYGFPYFDVGAGFGGTLERAYGFLTAP